MSEIMQADRDAALRLAMRATNGLHPRDAQQVLEGRHDKNAIVQAFARHREQAEAETVAKIAAWLRSGNAIQCGLAEGRIIPLLADATEAGEWK